MSELDELSGQPVTKEIGGVSITLKPLTMENFGVVMKAGSEDIKEREIGIQQMVNLTIKKSFPAEKNPLSKISIAYMEDLVRLVFEVNGQPIEEEKTPPLQEEKS